VQLRGKRLSANNVLALDARESLHLQKRRFVEDDDPHGHRRKPNGISSGKASYLYSISSFHTLLACSGTIHNLSEAPSIHLDYRLACRRDQDQPGVS